MVVRVGLQVGCSVPQLFSPSFLRKQESIWLALATRTPDWGANPLRRNDGRENHGSNATNPSNSLSPSCPLTAGIHLDLHACRRMGSHVPAGVTGVRATEMSQPTAGCLADHYRNCLSSHLWACLLLAKGSRMNMMEVTK